MKGCANMQYSYKTKGVCSSLIEFDIQNGVIKEVLFSGGCDGNLKGLSRLVVGMSPQNAAKLLDGIHCSNKGTSCPDQLSKALSGWIKEQKPVI